MDLGLAGKKVVVTGASRGIGRSIALAFADEGCHLAICARGEPALGGVAAELRERGAKVFAQVCDVARPEGLGAFLESARESLGGIDALVNNCSALGFTDDEQGWRSSFEVDVMGSVRASWKVVPWLEQAGGGSIVHISSTAALEAPGPVSYSAMKAALISLSKNQAIALAPKNIRVNCVAPGSIEFPGGVWDKTRRNDPERYQAMRSSVPSGRLGTPDEVAAAVVFLASERASWITGVSLAVDGGQHKGNL